MKQLKGKYLMVLIAVCGIAAASMGMLTNVSGLFFTPISEELGSRSAVFFLPGSCAVLISRRS